MFPSTAILTFGELFFSSVFIVSTCNVMQLWKDRKMWRKNDENAFHFNFQFDGLSSVDGVALCS
jgi:hypothetical protein